LLALFPERRAEQIELVLCETDEELVKIYR